MARRPRAGGISSRASRSRRSPAVTSASTTSLTVPPSASRIARTRSSSTWATASRRCSPSGTLRLVCGAAASSSRRARSTRPRAPSSPTRAGSVARPASSCRTPSRGGGGGSGARQGGGDGARVEHHGRRVAGADAVDQAVVGLGGERPAPVLEPLEQHAAPQRPRAVEAVRVEVAGPVEQLALAAGRRQRGPRDVGRDVEVGVVLPPGPPEAARPSGSSAAAGSAAARRAAPRAARAARRGRARARRRRGCRRCACARCGPRPRARGRWRRAATATQSWRSDTPRDVAGEGQDRAHRLVAAVGGRAEHARAAAVDHRDAVLAAVVGRRLGDAPVRPGRGASRRA